MRILHVGTSGPIKGILQISRPNLKEVIEGRLGHSLTDEEYLTHVIENTVPAGVPYVVVDDDVVPGDTAVERHFRNAWVLEGKGKNAAIVVDMPRARELLRNYLRARREPLLLALDIEYDRADEAGD